jgi:Ser-tRNA(Ala) deacylase AlaX
MTDGLDVQPRKGEHVAGAGAIGHAPVAQIEEKGKLDRRVRITLADA